MPGLFGYKQNPKTTEMFARMSAGERFGQAVGNANQSQIGRDAAAVELKRQRAMDDLSRQVQEAQIRKSDYRAPVATFNQGTNAAGQGFQQNSLTGKRTYNPNPEKPVQPDLVNIRGIEYLQRVGADGQLQRIPTSPIEAQQEANKAFEQHKFDREQTMIKQKRDLELTAELPMEEQGLKEALTLLDKRIELLDRTIGHKGFEDVVGPVTASWAGSLQRVGDEDASNFNADVVQLQSQLALKTLTDLKATGATMGALNEQELNILKTAAANLSYDQGEKRFEEELEGIRSGIKRVRDRYVEEYKIKYASVLPENALSWVKESPDMPLGYFLDTGNKNDDPLTIRRPL